MLSPPTRNQYSPTERYASRKKDCGHGTDKSKVRVCPLWVVSSTNRRNKSGVYRVLAINGGIAPAPRRRAPVALRLEEREEISRGIAAGWSMRRIAHPRLTFGSCRSEVAKIERELAPI